MKRTLHFTYSFLLLAMLMAPATIFKANAQSYGYGNEISLQNFYDELAPYGQWVDDPDYGYVWIPEVDESDFRPYFTNGYWVMTEYGNTWVSDYEWGWAPFHYGRWAYTDYYGWIWIPDTEWGPAWVSWRSGDDYYGWAPMGPRVSVDIAIGAYRCPDTWWNFIPRRYIYERSYGGYCLPYYRNSSMINVSIVIGNVFSRNNYRYVCGPSAYDIRRYGGVNVSIYNINNYNRPGRTVIRNNSINIYRPAIVNRGSNRPSRYVGRNDFVRNRPAYQNRGNDRNGGRYNPGNSNGRNGREIYNNRNAGRNNPASGSYRNTDRNRNFERNNNRNTSPGNPNAGRRQTPAPSNRQRTFDPQRNSGNPNAGRQNETRRRNDTDIRRTPSSQQRTPGNMQSNRRNPGSGPDIRRTAPQQRERAVSPGNNNGGNSGSYRNRGNPRGGQRSEARGNNNNRGGNPGNSGNNGNGRSRRNG